jgi:hypothetical protein
MPGTGKQYGAVEVLNRALNRLLDGFTVYAQNEQSALIASAARTATNNSAEQTNYGNRGVKVFIDVTAVTGSPSVTFSIQEKDSVGGDYRAILTSAAQTAAITAPVVLTVYPGCAAVANTVANEPLSRTWRVAAAHGNADSITYSVSYCYIP